MPWRHCGDRIFKRVGAPRRCRDSTRLRKRWGESDCSNSKTCIGNQFIFCPSWVPIATPLHLHAQIDLRRRLDSELGGSSSRVCMRTRSQAEAQAHVVSTAPAPTDACAFGRASMEPSKVTAPAEARTHASIRLTAGSRASQQVHTRTRPCAVTVRPAARARPRPARSDGHPLHQTTQQGRGCGGAGSREGQRIACA